MPLALWILGALLLLASLGVIIARKPVYAALSFLVTLLSLAAIYLQLSAQFIAVMQVLVYAGAILVIFMFVIILFQDAHQQLSRFKAEAAPFLFGTAAFALLLTLAYVGMQFQGLAPLSKNLPEGYGTVQSLGYALYIDFAFPFEAVVLIFLVALIGALYIGKKAQRS